MIRSRDGNSWLEDGGGVMPMWNQLVSGVYAALSVSRQVEGRLDESAYEREVHFLLDHGIRGLVINGATGEYCLTTLEELKRLVSITRKVAAGRADFLCGIGSADLPGCLERGRVAAAGGAKAVLLPAPHFYRYEQDDLEVFCREVAARVSLPVLLYNLPQFTHNAYQTQTVMKLIAEVPNIVGIKDSSGSLDTLRAITNAGADACRIVGSDGALAQALREGICDGVISGPACAVPELLLALFGQRRQPDSPEFDRAAGSLASFIEQVDRFPFPWGLKMIQELRGVFSAIHALPLSERRKKQDSELRLWYDAWKVGSGIKDQENRSMK